MGLLARAGEAERRAAEGDGARERAREVALGVASMPEAGEVPRALGVPEPWPRCFSGSATRGLVEDCPRGEVPGALADSALTTPSPEVAPTSAPVTPAIVARSASTASAVDARPGSVPAGSSSVAPRPLPRWYASLRDAALEALSPTRCAACERPGALLCEECLGRLDLIDPRLCCTRCGAPFGSMLCTECRGEGLGACARVLAACTFEGPAPRIVRAYKDAGERRLARVFAEMLYDAALHAEAEAPERYGAGGVEGAERLGEGDRASESSSEGTAGHIVGRCGIDLVPAIGPERSGACSVRPVVEEDGILAGSRAMGAPGSPSPVAPVTPERAILSGADAIAFVPATARAYRRRGFDHMEAVAREISALSGVPLHDCLMKHGRADQRELGREGRLEASRGLYEVGAPVAGMRLLLIDDVITTGATMDAAARALLEAGAAHVDGLAFARVW